MSNSEPVRVVIEAPRHVHTSISNSGFAILEAHHGRFYTSLPPGIYGIRFRELGATQHSELVVHGEMAGILLRLRAPAIPFASSAPLAETITTREWHQGPAVAASQRLRGTSQGLLVFVREIAAAPQPVDLILSHRDPRRRYADDPSAWAPSRPGAGLALLSATGETLFDFDRESGEFNYGALPSSRRSPRTRATWPAPRAWPRAVAGTSSTGSMAPKDHPPVAASLHILAHVIRAQGDLGGASRTP